MKTTQKIHCPNCGSKCDRNYYPDNGITETTCSICDYLMVTRSGKVIEAYAPGIAASNF